MAERLRVGATAGIGRWLMDAAALPYHKNKFAKMLARFGNYAYLCSVKSLERLK